MQDAGIRSERCTAETEVGTNEPTVFDGRLDLPITGTVYNLEPNPGLHRCSSASMSLLFETPVAQHICFLEGHVAVDIGDYHEYFEINNVSERKRTA